MWGAQGTRLSVADLKVQEMGQEPRDAGAVLRGKQKLEPWTTRRCDNSHRSFERGEMGHSIQSKQDANNLKISPLESLEEVQADLSICCIWSLEMWESHIWELAAVEGEYAIFTAEEVEIQIILRRITLLRKTPLAFWLMSFQLFSVKNVLSRMCFACVSSFDAISFYDGVLSKKCLASLGYFKCKKTLKIYLGFRI